MPSKSKYQHLFFFTFVTPSFFLILALIYVISISLILTRMDFRSSPAKIIVPSGRTLVLSQESNSATNERDVGLAVGGDARPVIIRKYLQKYNSPLLPFADIVFAASQSYGLDYRLLVAIAQQESNLCKKIPEDSFNCWGWGIHSRGTLRFGSYPEAIEAVAKGLKEDYLSRGLEEPEEIMQKYTPSSNGSWAAGVRQFMEEMESGFDE